MRRWDNPRYSPPSASRCGCAAVAQCTIHLPPRLSGLPSTRAMKTQILLGTALLLGIFTSAADNSRCVTVTATYGGPATIQIQQGETAELVSSVSTIKNGSVQITFGKSGGGGNPWDFGIPITGPATITANSGRWNTAVVTVKITPDSPNVNNTLILRPGTNQDDVTLESNTNQVYVMLEPSTNQVYVGA